MPEKITAGVPSTTVTVAIETLTVFRNRVNGLLASLDASPAAPRAIARQGLTADQLGTRFPEADLLMSRYGVVHGQLQALAQTLTDQIDAMGIALQVSQLGYQHVEADQIARLWAIQNRTVAAQRHAAATTSPAASPPASPPASPAASPAGFRQS